MATEPQNAAALEKLEVALPQVKAAIDKVNQMHRDVEDIKISVKSNAEILGGRAGELIEKLVASSDEINLWLMGKDGAGKLTDRLYELEKFMTEFANQPNAKEFANDPRAEAFQLYAADLKTNVRLADQFAIDPRLTVAYEKSMEAFLRCERAEGLGSKHKTVLGKAKNFAKGLLELNPERLDSFLTPEAMNALSSDWAPGGGIFVSPTMEARVLRKIVESSGVYALAGKWSTSSDKYTYMRELGYYPDVQDRGEREAVTENTEKTFWEERHIDIHDEAIQMKFSRNMLDDSGRDILAEFESLAARGFLRKQGTKMVSGTGVKQCFSLFSDLTVKIIKSGTASTMPLFRLTEATIDLLPEYLANARFILGIGMLKSAVLERDGINRPLWQPALPDGTPSLFAGYAWVREPYFDRETGVSDSGVTFATGAKVATFGDIGEAYKVVNRKGITVIRNEVTEPPFIIYTWMRRWGADVVLPDAFRIIQVST